MRKLFDKDGQEYEIPDEEELKKLQEAQKGLEELKGDETFQSLSAEHGTKNIKELLGKLKEGVNPNFPKLRKIISNLSETIKKSGKEIDEDGMVKEVNKNLTPEEVQKMIRQESQKMFIESALGSALNNINDKDSKEIVKRNFEKISDGEEINPQNINQFIKNAVSISGINQPVDFLKSTTSIMPGSSSANYSNTKQDYSTTEEGKALASSLGLVLESPKKS